ncbi:MAG: hypothetical protein SWH68_02015 [Thermodesulfobacteriota bacterium]|nr:hypothetical protein [Thermodesulfobacteriota bacterium]
MISGGQNRKNFRVTFALMLFIAAGAWMMPAGPLNAQPLQPRPLQIDARQQLALADHFFAIEQYDAAVTEYQRFCFFFPEHDRVDYARYRIAMGFFHQKAYETALARFGHIAGTDYAGEFSIDAGFMASRCYTAMAMGARAVANLKNLMNRVDDRAIHDRACYEIGWIYLETARPLTAATLDTAQSYFARISEKSRGEYPVGRLIAGLDRARTAPDGLMASMKRPRLAGGLAVVPGAGYLYTDRYQDALIAFLFNAGMIIAAVEAFDNGNEALGCIIAGVELGFYAGNIYGSISAAHKYNRQRADAFLNDLRPHGTSTSPDSQSPAIGISIDIPF